MSRWLALARGGADEMQTPPDSMTKPDKSTPIQPEGAFCQVLSYCQVEVEHQARPQAPPSKGGDYRHGQAVNGNPKTWTGKVVSLADWRGLSEWEKHGPDGRVWCGKAWQWVQQDRSKATGKEKR